MFHNGGVRPPPNFRGGGFRHPPPSGRGGGFGPPQRGGFYDNSFRGHNNGPPRGGSFRPRGFQHNGENNYRNNSDNNYQKRQNGPNQNKPWITQDIRVAIGCRNQLAQKARQSKSGEDFDALREQKQRVEAMIEESKMKFFKENPEREEEWLHVLAKESFTSATWCDVCEKGFESVHKLKGKHSAEHATCGVDGCSYTAHESLLEKHVRHQHLSGLFQKIPQGQSREEIEKWRAERRKNFPTRDKVAVKDAAREEARERGEVLRLQKIINKYTGVKDESEDGKENRSGRPQEPDWECNCKARFILNGGNNTRGRGGGGRGNRNYHVNIKRLKHQSHCQELVKIRERIKASNEEKAKIRLEKAQAYHERKLKEKEEKGENEEENKTDVNKHKAEPSRIPVEALDNIEDSDSEPEGMCGTLAMFPGIGKTFFHSSSLSVLYGEAHSADNPFHISDDEDDFSPVAEESYHISDDDDDILDNSFKTIDKAQDIPISDEEGSDYEHIENSNVSDEIDIIANNENVPPTEVKMVKDKLNEVCVDNKEPDDDGPPEETAINKTDPNAFPTDENNKKEDKEKKTTNKTDPEMPRFQTRKRKQKGDINTEPGSSQTKDNKKKVKSVLAQRIAPPTLLEKLLSDEILHERNVILQCVRYVCKNNFLQPLENKDNAI